MDWPSDPVRERYRNDPKFHRAVTAMLVLLEQGEITTEDLGRAAVLASQLYAERHTAPVMLKFVREATE